MPVGHTIFAHSKETPKATTRICGKVVVPSDGAADVFFVLPDKYCGHDDAVCTADGALSHGIPENVPRVQALDGRKNSLQAPIVRDGTAAVWTL